MLTQAAEWMSTTLLSVGTRNISRLLPFNMVVTNVPGPQFPLYMLGAKMLEVYPHVPIIDRLGIGVALLSYNGKVFWGLCSDYDLVPDLKSFTKAVQESRDALLECCLEGPVEPQDSGQTGEAVKQEEG